ncbi:MAG: A/G-specific adenine glycosylase [Betaproteobacteria bacterium]|nr:A/G-specific adenine glycosylase [Betaproteobacteria bacterium]MDE2048612.1 A/G-specific adenine glycosylase [Betaproteobacteria bacterium]
MPVERFAARLIEWQRLHGRHGLPWQGTRDPYRIWLSEIMLQQTQVATVQGYYHRFLQHFPDVAALAQASEDEVLALWSGLGYYSRARNLHAAARQVVAEHGGVFPHSAAELSALPGIGRSTAAAVAAFASGEQVAILDGNVKRVLARLLGVREVIRGAVERGLWDTAQSLLPAQGIEAYTQGLMDLGATVCTPRKPRCGACPFQTDCAAYRSGDPEAVPKRPAPRGPRVTRDCYMLVLHHEQHVLLVKRPPAGVWASLWCFPEYQSVSEAETLGSEHKLIGVMRPGPDIRHSFTHFDLTVHPLLGEVLATAGHARESSMRWVHTTALSQLGVPAIVGKLLAACSLPPA